MNTLTSIYQDIAKRTAGDIYIGVVGPARTGKSPTATAGNGPRMSCPRAAPAAPS